MKVRLVRVLLWIAERFEDAAWWVDDRFGDDIPPALKD